MKKKTGKTAEFNTAIDAYYEDNSGDIGEKYKAEETAIIGKWGLLNSALEVLQPSYDCKSEQAIVEKLFDIICDATAVRAYKMGVARGQLIAAEALANGAEKGENL